MNKTRGLLFTAGIVLAMAFTFLCPASFANDAETYFNRGKAYLEKGDYDQAIADFTQAIRLAPNAALAYGMRGAAYGNKGDHDRAISDYTQAIRLAPNYDAAYFGRGGVHYIKKDYDQAISDLTQAIQLNPNNPAVYDARGLSYCRKGDYYRAIKDYQPASQNYGKAIEDFQSALRIDPNTLKAKTIQERLNLVEPMGALMELLSKEQPSGNTNAQEKTAPPPASGGMLTDTRDGKKYKTVKIGSQTWMAENLNYETRSGSKCYDNNSGNCAKYGRLYEWNTARSACPSGWHLPSKDEYETLDKYVGGQKVVGKKLKAKSGWNENGNGTDEFGFSALPGGVGEKGNFKGVGDGGGWWSASDGGSDYAWNRTMLSYYEDTDWGTNDKSSLLSVRCLKD